MTFDLTPLETKLTANLHITCRSTKTFSAYFAVEVSCTRFGAAVAWQEGQLPPVEDHLDQSQDQDLEPGQGRPEVDLVALEPEEALPVVHRQVLVPESVAVSGDSDWSRPPMPGTSGCDEDSIGIEQFRCACHSFDTRILS